MKQLWKKRLAVFCGILLAFSLACVPQLLGTISFAADPDPDPAAIGTASLDDEGDTVFIRLAKINRGTEDDPEWELFTGYTVDDIGPESAPLQDVDMSVLTCIDPEHPLTGTPDKNLYICGVGCAELYVDGLTLAEGRTLTAVSDVDVKMGEMTVSAINAAGVALHVGDRANVTVNGDVTNARLTLYAPEDNLAATAYNPGKLGGALTVNGDLSSTGTEFWLTKSALIVTGAVNAAGRTITLSRQSALTAGTVSCASMYLYSSSVEASGNITVSSNVNAHETSALTSTAGAISVGSMYVFKSSVAAKGDISANSIIDMHESSTLTSETGVVKSENGSLEICNSTLSAEGDISAKSSLNFYGSAVIQSREGNVKGSYANLCEGAKVTAKRDIDISGSLNGYGAILVAEEGAIRARERMNLCDGAEIRAKTGISTEGWLCGNCKNTISTDGTITAQNMQFSIQTKVTAVGDITSQGFIFANGSSVKSTTGAVTAGGGNLHLDASTLEAKGDVTASGTLYDNHGSTLTTEGAVNIGTHEAYIGDSAFSAAGAFTAGNIYVVGTDATAACGDLNLNDRSIYVRGNGKLTAKGDLICGAFHLGDNSSGTTTEVHVTGNMTTAMHMDGMEGGTLRVDGNLSFPESDSPSDGLVINPYAKIIVGGNVTFGKGMLHCFGDMNRLAVTGRLNAYRVTDVIAPELSADNYLVLHTVAPFRDAANSSTVEAVSYTQPYRQQYILLADSDNNPYYADITDLSKTAYAAAPLTASHSIAYNLGDGTAWAADAIVADRTIAGMRVALPAAEDVAVPDGYLLSSWNTEEDGSGTAYAPGAQVEDADDLTLYAQLAPIEYNITVVNGKADRNTASVGTTITITAGAAPGGKTFDRWTTEDGAAFANALAAKTTFVMLAKDVTVTATYKDAAGGGSTADEFTPRGNGGAANETKTHASETATNPDGSTVTTELETSSVTTKDADGSVTVTETLKETVKTENKDGSALEVKTERTRSETTASKTNADGSVTDTTKVSAAETVTETATDANGGKTTTETKTELQEDTAVTTAKNADGSVTGKTETTSAEKVTEKVTDKAGKVTETVSVTKTESVTGMTTAPDGTATGTSTTTVTVTDANDKVLSKSVTEAKIEASVDKNGVTTTVTAATVTTTDADNRTTVVKTVTTETRTPDGSTGTVVRDENGRILSMETVISREEAEQAIRENRPIRSPLTVEPAKAGGGAAAPVRVELPLMLFDRNGDGRVGPAEMPRIELQVSRGGHGVVAMVRGADDRLLPVKECYEGSLIVPVTGSCELYVVDNTKAFADVSTGSWYGEYVTFVTAREIFNGTGGGSFAPDAPMTRAMLAQVLYNFARGAEAGDGTVFRDVGSADWYNAAVGWAYESGVVTGYGGNFGVGDDITRQDLATILYRYAKAAGCDVSAGASLDRFTDARGVADYAADAMRWAVGAGLIEGMGDGTLNPRGGATRAQVAAIMTRFVRNAR
ncbi:MAG: hypothetical protein E7474_03000 [Ruminococcaceae bacterium]|nr:hypothetical protein [Oscillospiraceae bacterium]